MRETSECVLKATVNRECVLFDYRGSKGCLNIVSTQLHRVSSNVALKAVFCNFTLQAKTSLSNINVTIKNYFKKFCATCTLIIKKINLIKIFLLDIVIEYY